jgi:prevent-host-death family protein
MEKTVGASEAKSRLSALLARAERGEVIVITRGGKAVAKLVPIEHAVDPVEVRKTLARLRTEGKNLKFGWNTWKSYRDEGRK